VGQALGLWNVVLSTKPNLHSHIPLLARAIGIASKHRIAVYDCLYVALAGQEGCKLVTADAKLLANLQAAFPFVISLGSLP